MKEESEKAGLKLSIQKAKIMASSPITSWQIDGGKVKTVTDFILGGSKITVDGDSSHKIKRCLLLGKQAMTNLESILKKQKINFANKDPSSQSYGERNGTPLQYSCLEKTHGRRSLVGCSPWGN